MSDCTCGHRLSGVDCPPAHESDVRVRFERDYALWQQETMMMSSVNDMCMNSAYQRIIGLGPAAVPLIIERLRREPQHFFWALTAIVGADMAAGADTVPRAAQAWVAWYDGLPSKSEYLT